MTSTLNDAADGFEAVINAIDSTTVKFYSEPEEKPVADGAVVNGELFFRNFKQVGSMGASDWNVEAVIELSTPSNKTNWSDAIRRIRDLTSPTGSMSIYQAIAADPTLGGRVVAVVPIDLGLVEEVHKKFHDGVRWTQELRFKVRLAV